ncbi:MAG: cytidine deaminase [Flavobacteriia bacterium]|nr:cytidine deaminase [Flavobacteriia bacterium]
MKKKIQIEYNEFSHYNELGDEIGNLVHKAKKYLNNAYAPYSHFHVSCILQLDNNETIVGTNQENIAYPSGICAERTALFSFGTLFPENKIKKLIIVSKGELIDENACLSPCGACRQVMAEYENKQNEPFEIYLISHSGRTFVFNTIKDLLIFPFGL